MMDVGIIGVGFVGGTLRYGFQRLGHTVKCYDIKWPESKLTDILDTQLVFVCVPTPSVSDGSCNTSIVEEVTQRLEHAGYRGLVVIKSTVPPGTTDKLHIRHKLALAFCPEFLREKCAYSDFVENHDVCIIGTYRHVDSELLRLVHGYYPKKFCMVTPMEAEFCKYFSNVFNALRINFACQFYEVCKAAGVDYSVVKGAISHRSAVGPHYLDCSEYFKGFGGSCLPKDTAAFAHYVKTLGVNAPMFQRIVDDNLGEVR